MNILKGEIEKLTISGSLTLIGINVNSIGMSAIVIDTPKTAPYLILGNTITVVFKETEVIIGSNTGDLITKVKCPVLIIPENAVFKIPQEIAFPTDYNIFYEPTILKNIS